MRVPVVWELTSEGTTQRCGVGLVRERKRAERRAQHSQPVVYGMGWGEAEDLNKRGLEIGGRYSCMYVPWKAEGWWGRERRRDK